MANITKATPRPYLDGIKDDTIVATPVQQESIPQNCPLYGCQTQRGPLTTQFVIGQPMLDMFGADSFDEAKKYYSHQTAAAALTAGEGNLIALRRLVSPDAAAGVFALGLEIVENDNPDYELNPDGSYKIDINGDFIDLGTTTPGYLKRLVKFPDADSTNWNTLAPVTGTLVGNTGQNSTIYPVVAFLAEVGEFSSNVGFRLAVPNANHSSPADSFAQSDQEALLYRIQWVERSRANAAALTVLTNTQADYVDFSFLRGMMNTKTNRTYDYASILTDYVNDATGTVPKTGPVESAHFYNEHLATALGLMFTSEEATGMANISSPNEINIMNETGDLNGAAYRAIQEAPSNNDTVLADGITINYMRGGSDGTVNEDTLDILMKDFLDGNWDAADEPLNDWAQYPFSVITDTGFALDTKYAILDAMGKRDDIRVDVCTFIHNLPPHDIATELSIGQSLQTRGLLSPESVYHGTGACRFNVWGSEGIYTRSLYKRRCSLVMDIVKKRADYAGAGDGRLKAEAAYDQRENNAVEMVMPKSITHTYKNMGVADSYWDLGINYVQFRTRTVPFWPAYQTGYTEDTSVLNSEIITGILTNIKRQAKYHWAINTGDSKLTKSEFKDRSDDDFADLVADRYDDRMVIAGNTRYTPDDTARGYSWTLDITAASDPSRTAGQYNITVVRPTE